MYFSVLVQQSEIMLVSRKDHESATAFTALYLYFACQFSTHENNPEFQRAYAKA